MHTHIFRFLCLLLCLSLLTGCGCRHTWAEADCVTPRTCSECGETEGEPLGHSWAEATCQVPRTCTLCAATEGDPLAHSEAVRDCAINYTTLTRQRETYCPDCGEVLSSEEVLLDALHDAEGFFFDSQSFWERYSTIDEQFRFVYLEDAANEAAEETTADTLTLECRDKYGYALKVRFHFDDPAAADGECASPRCTRILLEPAVSAELGDPDPNGLLAAAVTPEDKEYAESLREKTHTVVLNELMIRNLLVTFMTIDPNLDPDNIYGDDAPVALALGALDLLDGNYPTMPGALELVDGTTPGFILNGIYYYANENGELVMEPASLAPESQG